MNQVLQQAPSWLLLLLLRILSSPAFGPPVLSLSSPCLVASWPLSLSAFAFELRFPSFPSLSSSSCPLRPFCHPCLWILPGHTFTGKNNAASLLDSELDRFRFGFRRSGPSDEESSSAAISLSSIVPSLLTSDSESQTR